MAKKRRRKGPVSEAKREQGRRLAERMKRENGKFVGLSDSDGSKLDSASVSASAPKVSHSEAAPPVSAARKSRANIKTQDQKLVNEMRGLSSRDDSLLARRQRRRERELGI